MRQETSIPNDPLEAAIDYLARGWQPIPIPWQNGNPTKAPTYEGWTELILKEEQLAEHFPANVNVGLLLGRPSKGLVDVDLDCPEACWVASYLLPPTRRRSGRRGSPSSHYWYISDPPDIGTKKFQYVLGQDSETLVELRGTGGQTVVPPSIHPDGDRYRWEELGEPARVKAEDLLWAVRKIAICSLLARFWPPHGIRHDAGLPVAGLLWAAGWEEDEAAEIVLLAAQAAGHEKPYDRKAAVHSTFEKGRAGERIQGRSMLKNLMPEPIVDLLWKWASQDRETRVASNGVWPGMEWAEEAEPYNMVPQEKIEEPWPVLAEEALYGLAGDIVRAIDPYTESDPAAVLLHTLEAFGNVIGSSPHARVQHDHHPARISTVLVGETSKGRKGTGWSTPRYLFSLVDHEWVSNRVKSGLSSGEGLIYNVRDALWRREPVKEKGRIVDYQEVEVDPGESDKRLLIVEPEFASTLTVMGRDGNTLSTVIRQAWDDGNLSPLTRNNPMKATGAHISIIGHITKAELLARLDDTSKANGFANRFLWALVRRSKELPEGKPVPDEVLRPLGERLSTLITFSRTVSEIKRDEKARELWHAVYHDLSAGKPGLLGAVLSRAEAQVLRLSVIYALLDHSTVVKVEHLKAALALWEYCERSAMLIFGQRLGDSTADRILEALRNAGPKGMTENEIYELFGRHKTANERARALNLLQSLGLAKSKTEESGGRPRTVWAAA